MRKIFFHSIIVFAILIVITFNIEAQSTASNSNLLITLHSKILNENCKVFVSLPDNYNSTTTNYPVVYLLDGETFFTFASETAHQLTKAGTVPACIVIGITSNNRQRDFTTPVDKDSGQPNDISISGGATKFLEYMEKELIPTVSKKYRAQSYKVIIGHSLGGLFVYHSLYTKPELFQAHISIDGSLWWNKGKVGKSVIEYLSHHPLYKGKIFECRKDITQPVHFPVNIELLNYLDKNRPIRLEYTYLELKNENHATIVYPGILNGLKDVFTSYSYRSKK